MPDKKIGIIGAGGAVGSAAAAHLMGKGYDCILSYRNNPVDDKLLKDGAESVKLDLRNEDELSAFCKRADVILDCTGPSYVIGSTAAKTALKSGCDYVSAFGVSVFEDEDVKKLAEEHLCIPGAGTVPGLSGAAAVSISRKFDSCESLKFYSYALELSTKTSMIDVLLSSMGGYGLSDRYYQNEKILASGGTDAKVSDIFGIDDNKTAKMFLYNELVHAAKKSGIGCVKSFNVIPDDSLYKKMSEEMTAYAMSPTEEVLWQCADRLDKLMTAYMFGKKPEYVISLDGEGMCGGSRKQYKMCLELHNSLKATGVLAAEGAAFAAETSDTGLHWGYEALDMDSIYPMLNEHKLCSMRIYDSSIPDEEGEI